MPRFMENTTHRIKIKLKLDLFYIENYSIWLDLKLCMVTLKTIFKSESSEGIKKD